jgi:membrane-associated phospholipid phosphatase
MPFTMPLPPERSMRTQTRLCVLGFFASVVTGCSDQPTAPAEHRASPPASSSAVKFWDAGAAVAWNELATTHAARRTVNIFRLYAYLSLAQLRAAEAAEAIQPHPPISAAIAGASAVVLASYFPLDVAEIEAALEAQQAAPPWSGAKHADFAAGEAIGRDIGARVVAWSAGDGVGLTDPGVPPLGPGQWLSPGTIARGLLGARPFFLTADDEFRPGPPPAFGSPTFLAALAEVRQIADTRTPEQLASAIFWHLNHSATSQAAMQALARELIVRHRLKDAEAARVLFLANASMFDATIGCFDAKYHYWLIRPPQADPAIVTPFPTPAHPSYPSAHSCISGAITETLARAFPSERDRLEGVAEEASLSRLYAGIHYRFDMVAGLALGRGVAAKVSTLNLDDVAPLP